MTLRARLTEERDAYLLGLLRVAIASLLLLLTLKLGRRFLTADYFGDVFHLPLLPEALVPSAAGFGALLVVQGLGCVLTLGGVLARPALLTAAACGLYGLACDRLQYHNNRYVLLLVALLVAFTPCDRSFMPFRRGAQAAQRVAPRWAAQLIGAQLSLVYLASSLGKLLDSDWRDGTVMLLRFTPFRGLAELWLPDSLAAWLAAPWFGQLASLVAIMTELLLALGPWFARSRVAALWLGVVFHLGIELFARVELFSYTMLCAYLVFATPETRERRLLWRARGFFGPRLGRGLERLDWLARFRHERPAEQQALLVVVDRQGRSHQGLAGWRELARATPWLFPAWLPLWLLTWRDARRQA